MNNFGDNVIITGPARSGTTLVCFLLNQLENTVALDEPMDTIELASLKSDQDIVSYTQKFFNSSREAINNTKFARSKNIGGESIDNPYGEVLNKNGFREVKKGISQNNLFSVRKNLKVDFKLCVKHPAIFSALLGPLSKSFTCVGVVRNPLAILASWNSVQIPANQGRAPAAEMIDDTLRLNLNRIPCVFDRQLFLLSWYFERIYRNISSDRLILYEELIASKGIALTAVTDNARNCSFPLENKNTNALYDPKLIQELGAKLLNFDGAFWEYYDKSCVESLISEWIA